MSGQAGDIPADPTYRSVVACGLTMGGAGT